MKRIFAALLLITAVSCRSAGTGDTGVVGVPEQSQDLAAVIKYFNTNAADSFEGQFNIDGTVKKKKYRTLGSITFTRNPRKMNVQITDYIFKSMMAAFIQDEKDLHVYFPVDKRLFIDSMNTFMLKNYSDMDFDFPVLYDLLSGSIPVLKDYHVVNAVAEPDKNARYLILENDNYYETISFKEMLPDKILFIDKKSKDKVEIYMRKVTASGKGIFYRSIKILAPGKELNITVTYSDVKLNIPVKVKGVADMNLPKNISIIRH